MVMLYLDEEEYNRINMESYLSILNIENYNFRFADRYYLKVRLQ